MIFLYILILFSLGVTFVEILNKFNVFKKNKLNIFELLSFSMLSGLLIFVIYMFIFGVLGFKYSFNIFIPLIINFIFVIFFLLIRIFRIKIDKKNVFHNFNFKNSLSLLLFILFLIWIMYYMFYATTHYIIFPDEYAVWLLNPKNIFLGKRMNFFINTGLEVYPNFLPLLSSGYYFFVDKLEENSIRIFSSIFMLIGTLGLIGYCKRKDLNISFVLIMILFMFINYSVIFSLMVSSYGDIAFMTTYTIGMLYLFEWIIYDRKKEFLIISVINLMCYSFIKTEALYLLCFNIGLLIFVSLFYRKLKLKTIKLSTIAIYSLFIISLPIIWKIYNILAKFPSRVIVSGSNSLNLEYSVSLFSNMHSQFYECIPWVILLTIFLIGLFVYGNKLNYKEKLYIVVGIATMLINVLFLIICYLTIFGAEALTAASFIRYITRLYMIMIVISLISISSFFKTK